MSENLIFALVIGLTVYMFMRRLRSLKQQKKLQKNKNVVANTGQEPGSMPRIGKSGTITRQQIQSLKDNNFEPSRIWSSEEAQLILDTVTYLRSAIYMVTQEKNAPIEVQNTILKFILTNEDLRDYVYRWGLNRTRDERSQKHLILERNECFERVEAAIKEHWADT